MLTDKDGTKTVYVFLPYYKRGNLQDNINANNINKTFFPEKDLLRFFLKVCLALKELHNYHLPNIPIATPSETSSAITQPERTLVPYGMCVSY